LLGAALVLGWELPEGLEDGLALLLGAFEPDGFDDGIMLGRKDGSELVPLGASLTEGLELPEGAFDGFWLVLGDGLELVLGALDVDGFKDGMALGLTDTVDRILLGLKEGTLEGCEEGVVLGEMLGLAETLRFADGALLMDGASLTDGVFPTEGFSDGCKEKEGIELGATLVDGAIVGLRDGVNDGGLLADGLCVGSKEGLVDGRLLLVGILEILGEELGFKLAVGAGGGDALQSILGALNPPENSRL